VRTYTAKVVRGQGVGRKLGFPTANLKLPPRARPPRGVWEVRVCGASIGERTGACNVGRRPTLGGVRLVTEVRKNLYGKTLVVSFVRKIRAEKKFPSLPALRAQIRRDVESLRGV
jgi:riboflavin kinase / FMN adenylyltransferase